MTRLLAVIALLCAFTLPAQARHHHQRHHHYYKHHHHRLVHHAKRHRHHYRRTHYAALGGDVSYLPHPSGCPARAFCACGAAVEVFGSPIRSLWPASAWYKFPRTSPAPRMVAVRNHHVFVLRQHIEGSIWLVADYNSGGHRSRVHARSIAGYAIVNPHAARYARGPRGMARL